MEFKQGVVVLFVVLALCDAWGYLQQQSPRSMRPRAGSLSSASQGTAGLWNRLQRPSQFPSPSSDTRRFAQDPLSFQSKELMVGPVKPLDWRFPVVPEIQREVAVDFVQRQPVTPSSVAIQCKENAVLIEAKQDLFGNGQLIQPSGLSLGGCPAVGQDFDSNVLVFEYALQDCGSVLMMTEDELVYNFVLTYTPEPLPGTSINRADGAVIGIQCHYPRKSDVSSDALRPMWVPYQSTETGAEVLLFSLKLVIGDSSYERPSNVYYLGDVITLEASVKVYNHVSLRVFVDRCVASQTLDTAASPRYSFIENNGCFVDAKNTGSISRFLPQTRSDVLGFKLEAFMFQHSEHTSFHITCILKATVATAPTDSQHKSCSFSDDRWFAAYGSDQVCDCCDSSCGPETSYADVQWEGKASLGPLMVQEGRKLGSQ